jgi:predicted transcriptional regulator
MLAGIQAAALLIAAKRADQVSSEIAVHTEKTTDEIKILLQQNTELTQAVEQLTKLIHEKVSSTS